MRTPMTPTLLETLEPRIVFSAGAAVHSAFLDAAVQTALPPATMAPMKAGASQKSATKSPLAAAPGASSPAPLLHATAEAKTITLKWTNEATNQTGFQIQRSTDGTAFSTIASVGAKQTSYVDKHAAAGTTCTYRVVAFNQSATTAASATVAAALVSPSKPSTPSSPSTPATPPATPTPTTTLPVAPTNLAIASKTATTVTLTWKKSPTPGVTYLLCREAPGDGPVQIAALSANTLTYTDTTAPLGGNYTYLIAASTSAGNTWATQGVSCSFPAPYAMAPSNPTETASTSTSITLSWSEAAPGITNYEVLRKTPGTPYFSPIARVDASATTYVDTSVDPNTTYTYMVSSTSAAGTYYSAQFNASSADGPPPPPTNLAITNVLPTLVHLTWTNSTRSISAPCVLRSSDGVHFTNIGAVLLGQTYYNDDQVVPGTAYWYEVGFGTPGAGGYTAPVEIDTFSLIGPDIPQLPPSVMALSRTDATMSSISLGWTTQDGDVSGIHIYRRSGNDTQDTLVASLDPGATAWTDSGLADGTLYTYRVATWNQTGEATSYSLGVGTLAMQPVASASLAVSDITASTVTLTWAPSPSTDGYRIYRVTPGQSWSLVQTLSSDATTWADAGLSPSTLYLYHVAAFSTTSEMSISTPWITTLAANTSVAAAASPRVSTWSD